MGFLLCYEITSTSALRLVFNSLKKEIPAGYLRKFYTLSGEFLRWWICSCLQKVESIPVKTKQKKPTTTKKRNKK